MAHLNTPENRTKNPIIRGASPTVSSKSRLNSAKLALGSVITLASLTCSAISLAWVRMPAIPYLGSVAFPLYGLPYPIINIVWQSAEFFKAARNRSDAGFSAASHLICDLILGVAGLVLAIIFIVLLKDMDLVFEILPEYSENMPQVQTFGLWVITVFLWCGMSLVAALSQFIISVCSYLEIRQRYKCLEKQSQPAPDADLEYLERNTKSPLMPVQPAAFRHPLCEVFTNENPQEVGDNNMAIEMPGFAADDICLSALLVGETTRSNDQDSLEQDPSGELLQPEDSELGDPENQSTQM